MSLFRVTSDEVIVQVCLLDPRLLSRIMTSHATAPNPGSVQLLPLARCDGDVKRLIHSTASETGLGRPSLSA